MREFVKTGKKATKNMNYVLSLLTTANEKGMMEMIVKLLEMVSVFVDVNIEP